MHLLDNSQASTHYALYMWNLKNTRMREPLRKREF